MDTTTANNDQLSNERILKDMKPNVAAALCYVGGWISGIVFLVLEQKDRTIRFHALQSIIIFGILSLAISIFGNMPVMGGFFAGSLGLTAFILWIILLVKAINGEYFKIAWAGDLADRLANETSGQSPKSEAPGKEATNEATESLRQANGVRPTRAAEFKSRYYSGGARAGRIIGSAFIIGWSIVILILVNFYSQYIAYYVPPENGTNTWQVYTLITSAFSLCLPILNTALALNILGHSLLIAVDSYTLRQLVRIVLDGFGAAVAITFLVIFPFNFNVFPYPFVYDAPAVAAVIVLALIAAGCVIGAIVRFIKLIVNLVEGRI